MDCGEGPPTVSCFSDRRGLCVFEYSPTLQHGSGTPVVELGMNTTADPDGEARRGAAERIQDLLRSLAQWSLASLSVLSNRRGPRSGGTQKMDELLPRCLLLR